MARSHKERHQWKDKERRRTGESDPQKIKLHRERFVANMESRETLLAGENRQPAFVFRLRLIPLPEEMVTKIYRFQEGEVAEVPFLVENPEDCHYAIIEKLPTFVPLKEKTRLEEHVAKARVDGRQCHLEVVEKEKRLCRSVINCPYRKWQADTSVALCTL